MISDDDIANNDNDKGNDDDNDKDIETDEDDDDDDDDDHYHDDDDDDNDDVQPKTNIFPSTKTHLHCSTAGSCLAGLMNPPGLYTFRFWSTWSSWRGLDMSGDSVQRRSLSRTRILGIRRDFFSGRFK